MHAILSYRGNIPTNTATNPHTQTGPITVHCPAASARCNDAGDIHYSGISSGGKNIVDVSRLQDVCASLNSWSRRISGPEQNDAP